MLPCNEYTFSKYVLRLLLKLWAESVLNFEKKRGVVPVFILELKGLQCAQLLLKLCVFRNAYICTNYYALWELYRAPQMIPGHKWPQDRKWSPHWFANDLQCGPQMIPLENEEWHGIRSSGRPIQILLGNFSATFRILSNLFVREQHLATFWKTSTFLVTFRLFNLFWTKKSPGNEVGAVDCV